MIVNKYLSLLITIGFFGMLMLLTSSLIKIFTNITIRYVILVILIIIFYRLSKLFYFYLDDLNKNKEKSKIYELFLSNMTIDYINRNDNKKIIIDFIAGMTDDYFLNELKAISVNKK